LLFVAVPYADAIGLTPNTIRILARLLRDRPRAGGAITYGVQRIGGSYDELRELLAAEDLETRPLEADEIVVDPFAERGERVHQDTFFRMLGYSAVHSIDFVEDEHPTYRLDLNEPIPDELRASYDLVCDGGTTEHCFNVPQVLTNAVELLRPGGTVVHVLPTSGWLVHGFYQFTPRLFCHFYAENGFRDIDARIGYGNRCLDPSEYLPATDLLGHKALLIFAARKTEASSSVRWPIQGEYSSPEIERVVESFGGDRRAQADPGRRSIGSLRAWRKDLSRMSKQYLRLARRGRVT